MKILFSTHQNNPYKLKYPKEEQLTKKNKVLVARMLRTLAATVVGLVAAWLAGPDGLELVSDPVVESFVVAVIVPALITLDKMLRYGADAGEE